MPTQLASQTARLPGDGEECDTTKINDYKSCIVKAMEIRFGLGSTCKVAQITNSEGKIYTLDLHSDAEETVTIKS